MRARRRASLRAQWLGHVLHGLRQHSKLTLKEVGAYCSPDGSFRLHGMAYPFPQVAYVEGPAGSLYLESKEADRLSDMYDRLWSAALGDDESAEFIAAATKEFRGRKRT